MYYTRIFSDEAGETHFDDVEISLGERSIGALIPPLGCSESFGAESGYFLTFPPEIFIDWHPAPKRLFHFFLAGQCEVEVSDGSIRTFRQGDIVLVEDTLGKGHTTRNNEPVTTVMAVVAIDAAIF